MGLDIENGLDIDAKKRARRALKNLIGVCITIVLTFGPYIGILSLQSSINNEGGLGLASAATISAAMALTLPLIPVIYAGFGSKYSAIIGHLLFIVYACCNFYPSWYTLIPGSVAMGVALNLMFVSSLTHTSETASQYASSLGKNLDHVTALFLAIFAASVKGGHILGNLVSSSVLFNLEYNETSISNETDIFSNVSDQTCDNISAENVEKDYLYYVLIGIYITLVLIGIFITLTMWNNFRVHVKHQSFSSYFDAQVITVVIGMIKLFGTYKIILLFPLFSTCGIFIGFVTGTYTKVFVSDCIGVEWIGFAVSTYGFTSLVSAVIFGSLRQVIPSLPIIWLGVAFGMGMTIFPQFWSREPNYYVIFGYAIGWGISDSVWQAVVPGIVGVVFSADSKSSAFMIHQFGIAIGFIITFVSGIFLPISTHLWIIFSIILYAGKSYTILVIIMKVTEKLPNSKSSNVTNDESKLLKKKSIDGTRFYGSASQSASHMSYSIKPHEETKA